ncbi:hypothetical protein HPB48_011130 [Haemaphysalis longicornis]|uniref:Tc1-like transposase DDE domain-containing protein n=1 Tax=Haemaphysalis longicornis TaxID=44386 RepID=A0A9J6GVI9_HAELO|nr:hypothetical protein HPB48_011130 [Haemaphysalis longicornis]
MQANRQAVDPQKRLSGGRGGQRKKQLDNFDLSVLRRVVHSFFERNELPSVPKLTEYFRNEDDLPTVAPVTMRRMLNKLGFRFKKRSRNALLIEATHIVQWRCKYLREIQELRSQNTNIFYMDETWVNAGHTTSRVWVDETVESYDQAKRRGLSTGLENPSGKGGRLIAIHCGNENGFVEGAGEVFRAKKGRGDYHDEMNGAHFEKWLTKKLLPRLPSNSVIVMDNAPYHSMKENKVPRMSSLKKDMQDWLTQKGISWTQGMVKAELMKLVESVPTRCDTYRVDCIVEAAGHKVLRTPPYHCQLNPIELVWSDMKGFVAQENRTFKMQLLEDLVWKGINQATAAKWKAYVQHTENEEKKMANLDHIMDNVADNISPVVINMEGDSSSDDSSMSDGDLGCEPLSWD